MVSPLNLSWRRNAAWCLAALVVVGALTWWYRPLGVPVVNGRSIAVWFRQFEDANSRIERADEVPTEVIERRADAIAAIRKSGPAGVRYLASEIELSQLQGDWLIKYNDRLRNRCANAIAALYELGDDVAPAIPSLGVALEGRDCMPAANFLNHMGSVSWPAVKDQLSRQGSPGKISLLYSLDRRTASPDSLPPDDEIAEIIAAARNALHDEDPSVRLPAMFALSQIQGRLGATASLEPVVKAIVEQLDDPDPRMRIEAIRCLEPFRREAATIVFPALKRMLFDSDSDVRVSANGMLKNIPVSFDPQKTLN